jgi:hypothetical protein
MISTVKTDNLATMNQLSNALQMQSNLSKHIPKVFAPDAFLCYVPTGMIAQGTVGTARLIQKLKVSFVNINRNLMQS